MEQNTKPTEAELSIKLTLYKRLTLLAAISTLVFIGLFFVSIYNNYHTALRLNEVKHQKKEVCNAYMRMKKKRDRLSLVAVSMYNYTNDREVKKDTALVRRMLIHSENE